MAINPADAAAAYRLHATPAPAAPTVAPQGVGGPAPSFLDLVQKTAQNAVEANRHAEEVSARAMTGEANLTDVVTAVANAETQLQTVVQVRDRIISAYQEILRTPI